MSSYDERIEVKKSLDNIWKMKISELHPCIFRCRKSWGISRSWTRRSLNAEIFFSAPGTDTEDPWISHLEKSFIGFFQLCGHGSQFASVVPWKTVCVCVLGEGIERGGKPWKDSWVARRKECLIRVDWISKPCIFLLARGLSVSNMQPMCHSFLLQRVSALVIFRP